MPSRARSSAEPALDDSHRAGRARVRSPRSATPPRRCSDRHGVSASSSPGPRSFCAGVVRAIDIVEKLLERHGPPVYVRHEIVHNVHVVRDLEARGAVFVDSEDDVPEGALVVLSAHGVAPQRLRAAAPSAGSRSSTPSARSCPRCTPRRAGTPGAGTRSRSSATPATSRSRARWARRRTRSCSSRRPTTSRTLELEEGQRLAYLTQTTLSLDDTAEVVDALRERVPDLVGPPSADICYATQNRQDAVKRDLRGGDARARRRLGDELEREPAGRGRPQPRRRGLPDRRRDRSRPDLARGHETVGLTAGASSPEVFVERVVDRLDELGFDQREDVEIAREDVFFRLPAGLR